MGEEPYRKPARNCLGCVSKHWIVPTIETCKFLAKRISHIHAREAVHTEEYRFRRFEIPLCIAVSVGSLWHLDPSRGQGWDWRWIRD